MEKKMSVAIEESILPKYRDVELAEQAIPKMESLLSIKSKEEIEFAFKKNKHETAFLLTPNLVKMLFNLLVQISKGNAVTIVPIHAELTTQQAADLLNVSRPYLIKLLEQKKIPFNTVGKHRRIKFADLLKYREKMKEKAKKIQNELTQEAQDLNLGY
jgi:excisionase family DNA binding protein